MKVIKARVKKTPVQKVVAEVVDDFSDITDYPVKDDRNTEQFASVELTPETFLPLLENSRLPDDVWATLVERYDLRPVDNGVAVGMLGKWLSEQLDSFTEKHLDDIANIDNVWQVAEFVLENLINHSWIRGGMLKPNFIIPLIGESNHVKTRS